MGYFADLTPYAYVGPADGSLNVGWLDYAQPYPVAEPAPAFVDALFRLIWTQSMNLCRGSHMCPFCSDRVVGNGEIRVTGEDGVTYAAPLLIAHYVRDHHYAPPDAFVEAVLRAR